MKLTHAQQIVAFLTESGEEATLYEDYSGRCMYGRKTTGIVTSSVGDVAHAMAQLGIDDSRRSDSMGLDYIVY